MSSAPLRRGRPPRSEAPDGRARLLAAAREVFGERGYGSTTVADLVSAAGVNAPTLYHHFDGKAGLFLAAAQQTYEPVIARFREAVVGIRRFDEAVEAVLAASLALMDTERVAARMFLVIQFEYPRRPELAQGLRPLMRAYRAFFDDIAALAPADLAPTRRARVDLARALVSLVTGLNSQALLLPRAADFAGLVRGTQALLAAGLPANHQRSSDSPQASAPKVAARAATRAAR
jgi:AcrR family transcriptional regulator